MENRFNAGKTHKRQEADGKSEETRAPRNAAPIQNDVAIHEDFAIVVRSINAHVVRVSALNHKHR